MKSINGSQHSKPDAADSATVPSKHRAIFVSRWAAIIGALAIGIIYLALPENLTFGPNWLLLAIEAVLLIPSMFIGITRRPTRHITLHFFGFAVLAIVTLGLAGSIGLLVNAVITGSTRGIFLLRSAALLWVTNILVFSLWYWEIDGGGPHKRHMSGHQAADFMFPQQADGNKTGWAPLFVDYVFLAFTASTALSPADTLPLSRPAKLLMMTESILSLIIIVLLAARAVNILGG
jgi:hypothetical protein